MSRWPCKDHLKGACTNSFYEKWHPPECLFYKAEKGCRFGRKCSCAHHQVDEQPGKRSKKNGDKSAVATLKKHEQHFRTERPLVYDHSLHDNWVAYYRKSSDIRKPIRCVKFTKAVARTFETEILRAEWQEQGAREAAWKPAKSVLDSKKRDRAIFSSPSENRCLLASNLKLEER